jgi:hypothetical protein
MDQKGLSQAIWACLTCDLTAKNGYCEVCAMTCHSGHELAFVGMKVAVCACGARGAKTCLCDRTTDYEQL